MRRVLPFVFGPLLFIPTGLWAQGNPLGFEFRVNTYTTNQQARTAVASDAAGNFVVVWNSVQDGGGYGIFGQRYASSGAPVDPEFQVNTYTTSNQGYPSVAADPAGNFVVVWRSLAQDGSGFGVFGQRYASSGSPMGPEFRVNTYTTSDQGGFASVVADPFGNFVVVWNSGTQDGGGYGIFGQRYASSGAPLGPEFRVNTYTTSDQTIPVVAADTAGNFIVIWRSYLQDGSGNGTFGQRYASSGAPLGPEFRVNTYTTNNQGNPSVAADTAGNFVVVWQSDEGAPANFGIFGQRYASSGAPLGPEFRVNTFTLYNQFIPSVAADTAGNFVVVWHGYLQDNSGFGVFGQRYASSGTPLGPEFRVNTYTTDDQDYATVAADSAGNFVVNWQSFAQDGSNFGVFGQRYGRIVPVELMQFGVED